MVEKLIDECPVCHSKKLIQEVRVFEDVAFVGVVRKRIGSYCEDCGTKNIYNSQSQEIVDSHHSH